MSEKQKARNEDDIKMLIAEIILRRVKDPRVSNVSITNVEASSDYSVAKVLYNVIGGESADIATVQKGLDSCKSYIRNQIKKHMHLHTIPQLVFIYDKSLDRAMKIEELLAQIRREEEERGKESADG
jgi:ribosome-binding factor A